MKASQRDMWLRDWVGEHNDDYDYGSTRSRDAYGNMNLTGHRWWSRDFKSGGNRQQDPHAPPPPGGAARRTPPGRVVAVARWVLPRVFVAVVLRSLCADCATGCGDAPCGYAPTDTRAVNDPFACPPCLGHCHCS